MKKSATKNKSAFSQWLAAEMRSKKTTARKLADYLKQGQDSVNHYKYGLRNPSEETVVKLEEFFGSTAPREITESTTHDVLGAAMGANLKLFLQAAVAAMHSVGYEELKSMGINTGELMDMLRGDPMKIRGRGHHSLDMLLTSLPTNEADKLVKDLEKKALNVSRAD